MTIKTSTKLLNLREQIIEDAVSGLTLKLERAQDGTARLKIYGVMPFGTREFIFDGLGQEAGARTAPTQLCCPSAPLHFAPVSATNTVPAQQRKVLQLSRMPSRRRGQKESMRALSKNVQA
jgi:hypothetical protein